MATEIAVRAWRGDIEVARVIPEGLEDVSLEQEHQWFHLQAKARRAHRGDFSQAELVKAWKHLAERVRHDPTCHVGLVLERHLAGVETGFDQTLANVAEAALKKAVAAAVRDLVDPEDFLGRAHVIVMPATPATGVQAISEVVGAPAAACLPRYEILRGEMARLADENGEPARGAANPAGMTVSDVVRLFDDVAESIDPSLLAEAVHSGAVELVDFRTSLDDPAFYTGVDVVPGHVVAGLPIERAELVAEVENALASRLVVLAVGPSGAGKSALLWLTAYAGRHRRLWYRVRRLSGADVVPIVRLVKSFRPAGSPIGLVVDDLGREDRSGFDALVDELRNYPEAVILGGCREEDLYLIRTSTAAAQVRPVLDEVLAERLWSELRERGESKWTDWREPFEKSEGLLLEFGHLLTEGTRLAETVTGQVARRVREERDLEIQVLSLIATADAYGADLRLPTMREDLNAGDAAVKRALARLVDEHLISQHDGVLSGLHELRSRHISSAIHTVPPPIFAETVRRLVTLLDARDLQRFMSRVLLEHAVADDAVIGAVAARIQRDPDAGVLAASLNALRLVGFRRTGMQWRTIFAEEGVAPTNATVVTFLAFHEGDATSFPEPIRRVVGRVRALENVDHRGVLLDQVAVELPEVLARTDIADLTSLLKAAAGVAFDVDASAVAAVIGLAPLSDVESLLEATLLVDRGLAIKIVDALGGAGVLVQKVGHERPWVRNARVGESADGELAVFADYAAVAESVQPDAHEAVVELARSLLALVPQAEVAICRAVDARGTLAGFGGFVLADKAIPRGNMQSAEVAWNRARGRAAIAALSAVSDTEYLVDARGIVIDTEAFVRRLSDVWVRGQRATSQLHNAAIALQTRVDELQPRPVVIDRIEDADQGESSDPVSYLGTMVASNLYPALMKGEHVTPRVAKLIEQVDRVSEADYWRLLGDPPLESLRSLRGVLVALYAVAAETGSRTAPKALQEAGKRGLAPAARVARRRANARMRATAAEVEKNLAETGFGGTVYLRPGASEGFQWPADEVLVVVEVPNMVVWMQSLEDLAARCRQVLADRASFWMAPLQGDRVVRSRLVKLTGHILPAGEDLSGWQVSALDECLGDLVRRVLEGLTEASSIMSIVRDQELHVEELDALEGALSRASNARSELEELAADTADQLLIEVVATVRDEAETVLAEAEAATTGAPVAQSLASAMLDGLDGQDSDRFRTRIALAAACVEWDVNPDGAWDRFSTAFWE